MNHDPRKRSTAGKIAFFLPSLETAGAERVTVLLANGLAQRGYAVDVVLVQAKGDFLADLIEGVHVVDLKSPRTMRAIPRLANYMRNERPRLLISALDYVNVAALIAGRLSCTSTPVVAAVHTSRANAAQRGPGMRGVLFSVCVNWFYRRAGAIVCVSQGVADDMVRIAGVDRNRVRVIYNPVIHPCTQELARQPVDHPWCAPPEQGEVIPPDGTLQGAKFLLHAPGSVRHAAPRLLVAVGRLAPQKDFATLLRALSIVRRDHDVRLIILGEGNERVRLERLVEELNLQSCVSMPGIARNPYAYMSRADLFVLSSAWEALPTVLIEALAVGAPVVATDCVSGPREILKDGRYGRLAPVGSVEGLAKAVSDSLSAPRSELPQEALRPYTVEYAVNEYCRFIEETTGG